MSATHLVVVPRDADGAVEPLAARARRLQAEARAVAREHVEQLRAALAEVARISAEIADGGEAYPVGAREISRRLADDTASQALTLSALNDRMVN